MKRALWVIVCGIFLAQLHPTAVMAKGSHSSKGVVTHQTLTKHFDPFDFEGVSYYPLMINGEEVLIWYYVPENTAEGKPVRIETACSSFNSLPLLRACGMAKKLALSGK